MIELRLLLAADAAVIATWAGDPEFCAHAGWSADLPVEQHIEFWQNMILAPPGELLRLAAVDDAAVVGYVDLHGESPTRRELGFVVGGRERWGHGIGTAMARAGLAHGFDRLGLQEIWAEAVVANRASVRILRRIGMRETGPGEPEDFLGRPSRYRQFLITALEWTTQRAS